ncbi:MAG: putative DNA polymerase beta domain protein region [Promethearchaeota archaeon]|nr:MAG: putative DNA polymerase beta domain protein region [Candidatus Lokiarchaeota archaeon]
MFWMKMNKNKKKLTNLFSEMIKKVDAKLELYAFIIFGSQARGNALPYSDYDIVIIADFQEKYIYRSKWIVQIAPEVPIDIFCYTPQEFDKLFSQYNLTAIDAIDEGIFLKGEKFLEPYVTQLEEFKKRGMRKTDSLLIPPSS